MPSEKVRKHWKVYRGTLLHRDMDTEVYWASSEREIKTILREARNLDRSNYDGAGGYSTVYIEPTKHGVIEWLRRNINYDNG